MTSLMVVVGAWFAVAFVIALVIGRSLRRADRRPEDAQWEQGQQISR